MICAQCGYANGVGEQICANCGSWLPETPGAEAVQRPHSPFDQPAYLDGMWRDADPNSSQEGISYQQLPDGGTFPGGQNYSSPWQAPGPARQNSGFQYPVPSNGSGFDY